MIQRPRRLQRLFAFVTGPHPRRRVFLIGFMGAGKTTVGRILAQRLEWSFYDLDEEIEQRERQSIAQIFDQLGESAFREIESAALMDLLKRSEVDCVIALGGGAFIQPGNRKSLEQAAATTVLLTAPVEELRRRCQGAADTRPLARDPLGFQQLFATRQQAYALAQFRVETWKKEPTEVAEEIARIVKSGRRPSDTGQRPQEKQ